MTGVLLAVGETMAMIAPERAEPFETASRFRVDVGGAESNVAMHVVAEGRTARWYGRVGDDEIGRRILARLGAAGVDVGGVERDTTHQTGLYLKAPGAGVRYYRRDSAASHLDAAAGERLDLSDVAIVHVSGITPALSAGAADFVDVVIGRCREAGIAVSFDVNHRPALWAPGRAAEVLAACARRADIVFVGRDEAEAVWGLGRGGSVRHLLAEVPELVVKDAEVGATAFVGDAMVFAPAFTVDVVEPVGAGDAFAGGYLAARMAGRSPAERLRAGHRRAAATLATTADVPDERTDP